MELPATQAMDDELPPTQQFINDEEIDDSPVGTLVVGKTSYPVLRGITSIGRHPRCKVNINDVTVSANHATIEAENSKSAVFIKDLGSTNKTKINDTFLRPHSNYQIKDGDKINFGSIVANFKLFQSVEDSLISCTPQINRKVQSVIPGTPDSMNASSASEGDVSMIPGTQNDGICFRQPETSSKRSINNDHNSPKVPAFNMDDFEDSIYSAETQKSSENKSVHKDESIYELETQRSSDIEKDGSSIEDLETQQCDPKLSNSTTSKLHDVSIYSAETQKQISEDINKDKNNIEDLATQRCDPKLLNNTTSDSYDASIYSAETQKQIPEEGEDKNTIEDLETQRCDSKLLNSTTSKSHDTSIYSAEIQKHLPEVDENDDKNNIEDLETQRFDPKLLNNSTRKLHNVSIYSAETQKQLPEKETNNSIRKSVDVSIYSAETQKQLSEEETNNSIRKSMDVSIYSAETQKAVSEDDSLENLETQQFIIKKLDISTKKSTDTSIYYAETQKVSSNINFDESIENMETQKIDTRKSHIFHTPNLPKIKSTKKSLSEMETQKYDPDSSLVNDVPLEDAETERFECEKSDAHKRKSEGFTPKSKSVTENLHEAETQKYLPDTTNRSKGDESIDDLETQQFISNNSNVVINESTDNIESQKPAKPKSIEYINTLPFDEEIPQNQSNQHASKSIEETNNKDIIDQPGTVCSENVKTFSEDNISINNVDISKSAELDVEDEMFSQNLIEDCPFEFLPDKSQENIDQEMHTSKNSKEFPENKNNTKDSISNLSDINNESNISINKNPTLSVDNDSETDEEGIFSNPTSMENSTKTNIEKSNSDSETDEEGVFSSHMSRESENSEIRATNKCSNTETDEGVFSNPSKSNKKLNNENNETDSETDEEGVFLNSLSETNDMESKETKTTQNNISASTAENNTSKKHGDDTLDNSLKAANKMKEENNKSVSEPSKVPSLSFKRNSSIRHSPIPDSDDSLFEDIDDGDKNKNTSEKSELKLDKPFDETGSSASKANQSTSNENNKKTDSVTSSSSNANESLNAKGQNSEVDDLAPTQILDSSKSIIDESDSEDECLAPTQVISPKKVPTTTNDKEDIFLEPTQPMTREKSPVKQESEKFEPLILSPTQKIDTQDLTEVLSPTENIKSSPNENEKCSPNENKKNSPNEHEKSSANQNDNDSPIENEKKSQDNENFKMDRNGSVEDLEYETAPTQPIEDEVPKESINSSKRQLEELEITCNKKIKCVDVVDSNIEKDLVQMFEGPEEDKVLNQGPELLTQQLEDILQSSQVEEDPLENMTMVPSPTISSNRKTYKAKNRRKATQLKKGNTSSQGKKINVDLNDTIERNMNDIFNSSINEVESYEPDSMMTQQLANVLESQDPDEAPVEETKTTVSPNLSTRASRSKLNASSSSKGKNKPNSKTLAKSRVSPVKEEPKLKKNKKSAEESQETEEYFANLKSKKKRTSVIMDSQEEQRSDNEKELVYKHGIVGFVDDIGAIRTSKRVPLYEPKGMPFTSDSQSEGEDPDNSQRQKRFSLSLSKNVDLNSSLSDYDLESAMTKTKTSAGKGAKHKRVLAKGTRGFERSSKAPVECEELVSAPSTEGEEEIGSSQQKVGNLDSSLRLSLDVESGVRLSQSIDSDEEFLKSMPDVKVAGTADCPPTNSQLAAPCDDDDDAISLASVVIPSKNQLYAQRRFDLIYKKPAVASANGSSEDEREGEGSTAAAPRLGSPLQERSSGANAQDIEEFIAKLGRKRRGDVTPQGTPASASRSSRAGKRGRGSARLRTPSGRPATRGTSNLGAETPLRHSLARRANYSLDPNSDSDSDFEPIIRKYELSEDAKNFKRKVWNMTHPRSAVDDEPDENDLEFARLREQMERTLARPKTGPRGARGGRNTCALTGRMLSGAGDRNTTSITSATASATTSPTTTRSRTKVKAGIADEDTSVFQVSSAGVVDRGSRKRPPLAITRSKRTAAEDSQNQPPKRAKTQNDHVKLQELSDANDQSKKAEKNVIKFPKPSESYVVLQRTKSKIDNTEMLVTSNSKRTQSKGESEAKPATRRNKAAANETTKAGTSIAKGLSSSKDSVVVEDSDAESTKPTSTRGTRTRRNNDSNSSVEKNSSKSESSGNSSEEISKSTRSNRGKTVRQTQKKSAPIKNEIIIPDSDQESDEPMSKSKEKKTVHRAADSGKVEETKRSTSKSTRSRRVKDLDTKILEDSETFVNPAVKSRRNRNAPIEIVISQDSDSEFAEENKSISKKEIKIKKNVRNKTSSQSDSERSASSEKNIKLDIPAENKKTRNTRRAKAQNSSNSIFSESDNDQSKNLSLANESKSSRPVRQTRKRGATDAISPNSQEEAEFISSSAGKSTNGSRTRTGRATKKSASSSNSSSQNSRRDGSQSDNASDKSTDKAKRAKVTKSTKNVSSSRSPTPSLLLSPTRSRRSSIASPVRGFKHKVLFTGDKSEAHKHIASKLGASVIDDPGKCTILVTDKVRRTCKFFCCVARGIPIVSFSWLDESLKARHFLDWEDYLLEDLASEAKFKFNLKESLGKARKQPFLEGYTVLCSQIPSTVLSTKELKDIVTSSGGKPLFRAPAKWPEKIVIVTIEDKLQNAKKLIAKAPKSVTIQSTEFLFTGILRQEVNFQEFRLS